MNNAVVSNYPDSDDGFTTPSHLPPNRAFAEKSVDAISSAQTLHSLNNPIPSPEDNEFNLRELWQSIVKWRWSIIVFTSIILITTVTTAFLTTPFYRSSLTLQINRDDIHIVKVDDVSSNNVNASNQDYYQTQYELLKTRSLAIRVIHQLGLDKLPPPPPSSFVKLKEWFTDWLPRTEQESQVTTFSGNGRMEGAINDLLDNLMVEPIRNSRLVRLYDENRDPKLAAAILHSLVQNYISMNMERRFEASTYAHNFLQERLQQIKAKLEDSEQQLITFARQEQIVNVDDNLNLVSPSLSSANMSLAEINKKRVSAEAAYQQMLVTPSQGLSQVLSSAIVQTLKENLVKLEAQYRDNLTLYKPGYPSLVRLHGDIESAKEAIEREVNNIRASIRSDYESAKVEENMLGKQVEHLKEEVLKTQDRSIRFNVLRREVDTNRQLYDSLLQRFKEVGVAAGVGNNNASVVDEATIPTQPFKPNLTLDIILALVVGLIGSGGLIFLFERLDDTFTRPEEIEKISGLPMLGVIPKIRQEREYNSPMGLVGYENPRSAFAEAYRSVRTTLQLSTVSGVPHVLAITSAVANEGKTTTALSLAIQFAQTGQTTLIIEADLREPSLCKSLQLDNSIGLTNYLSGSAILPADITRATHVPRLFAIPSGPLPPNPADLLSSGRMLQLLTLAAAKFDQVIVDCPPLLGLADALIITNLCAGTVLAVEMGSTPHTLVLGTIKRLRETKVHIVGAIMTKLEDQSGAYGYCGS